MPVLSIWLLRHGPWQEPRGLRDMSIGIRNDSWNAALRVRWILLGRRTRPHGHSDRAAVARALGTEIFPRGRTTASSSSACARPTGTRLERTELMALKAIDVIKQEVGPDNVEITTGFIGVQPPTYPINTIYLFTSGPQEAVLARGAEAVVGTDDGRR